jgi:hypothetical protein
VPSRRRPLPADARCRLSGCARHRRGRATSRTGP